jgi:hypothetical protein
VFALKIFCQFWETIEFKILTYLPEAFRASPMVFEIINRYIDRLATLQLVHALQKLFSIKCLYGKTRVYKNNKSMSYFKEFSIRFSTARIDPGYSIGQLKKRIKRVIHRLLVLLGSIMN